MKFLLTIFILIRLLFNRLTKKTLNEWIRKAKPPKYEEIIHNQNKNNPPLHQFKQEEINKQQNNNHNQKIVKQLQYEEYFQQNNNIEKKEEPEDSLSKQKVIQQVQKYNLIEFYQEQNMFDENVHDQNNEQNILQLQILEQNIQFEVQNKNLCLCGQIISKQEQDKHEECKIIVKCQICNQNMILSFYKTHLYQNHENCLCLNCGKVDLNMTNDNHRLRCFQLMKFNIDDAKMQQLEFQYNYFDQDDQNNNLLDKEDQESQEF